MHQRPCVQADTPHTPLTDEQAGIVQGMIAEVDTYAYNEEAWMLVARPVSLPGHGCCRSVIVEDVQHIAARRLARSMTHGTIQIRNAGASLRRWYTRRGSRR